MKTLAASLLVFLVTLTGFAQVAILQDGTPVKLRFSRTVSSAQARVGEPVDLEVLEDVFLNKDIVISKGSTALAVVTAAQPKRRIGRRGKLSMNIDSVRLTNGSKAALRGTQSVEGGSPGVAMGIGIGASAVLFFPAAPFFLLMHGSDTTIPQGTEVTTYINGDVRLDQSSLLKVDAIETRTSVAVAPLTHPCIQTSTGTCQH